MKIKTEKLAGEVNNANSFAKSTCGGENYSPGRVCLTFLTTLQCGPAHEWRYFNFAYYYIYFICLPGAAHSTGVPKTEANRKKQKREKRRDLQQVEETER